MFLDLWVISITSKTFFFDNLSWPEAAKASSQKGSTLVWPFGACEQHGPHLPLKTDTFFAENILIKTLARLPEDLPIWMLPSQSIGFSPEHVSFPGTLSLSAPVLLALVSEIGEQIASMGFKRLVFFNAHGGQIGLLQAVSRQLRVKCPSLAVLPCFLWSGVDGLDSLLPHKEVEEGLHAALAETSLMMNMAPEMVALEKSIDMNHSQLIDSVPVPKGWSLEGAAPCAWLTEDISKDGVIGDSNGSNAALGESLEELLIAHWRNLFFNLMESDWPPVSQKNLS